MTSPTSSSRMEKQSPELIPNIEESSTMNGRNVTTMERLNHRLKYDPNIVRGVLDTSMAIGAFLVANQGLGTFNAISLAVAGTVCVTSAKIITNLLTPRSSKTIEKPDTATEALKKGAEDAASDITFAAKSILVAPILCLATYLDSRTMRHSMYLAS
jgi:hypothetical protein